MSYLLRVEGRRTLCLTLSEIKALRPLALEVVESLVYLEEGERFVAPWGWTITRAPSTYKCVRPPENEQLEMGFQR